MDFADLQFMDGVHEHPAIYKDGCKKCKRRNVQFLFLFNDCVTGIVCKQGFTTYTITEIDC